MQAVSILEGPWRDPVEVLGGFADEPFALALLSDGGERGRWSYVARRPDAVLALTRDDPRDPAAALRDLLGPPLAVDPDGPPFQGGLAGLAAYELGARFETVALARSAGWPDLVVGRYAVLLAFDHRRRRMLAVGRGAAVSVVLVMTVLPQFILLMDKLIDKTSFSLHLPSTEDAAQSDLVKEEQA